MNNIVVSGRLGADPELNHVGDDSVVVNFSVAEEHGYGTNWFNVAAWGSMGETIAEHFSKGDFIEVQGSMEQNTYESDGEERTAWQVRASRFGFGGGSDPESEGGDDRSEQYEDDAPF